MDTNLPYIKSGQPKSIKKTLKYSKKNSKAPLLLGLEGSRGPDCPLCAFPRLRCNEDNLNKQCYIIQDKGRQVFKF